MLEGSRNHLVSGEGLHVWELASKGGLREGKGGGEWMEGKRWGAGVGDQGTHVIGGCIGCSHHKNLMEWQAHCSSLRMAM